MIQEEDFLEDSSCKQYPFSTHIHQTNKAAKIHITKLNVIDMPSFSLIEGQGNLQPSLGRKGWEREAMVRCGKGLSWEKEGFRLHNKKSHEKRYIIRTRVQIKLDRITEILRLNGKLETCTR